MRKLVLALAASAAVLGGAVANAAETEAVPAQNWSFSGIFGTFDRAAAQRGFQVFKENCNSCHSLSQIYYRNLTALGFSEDDVKAIAAEYEVTDGPNDQGEMFQRPARPSDRFHAPFPNPEAARAANGGALPPDLSLIVKARAGGADYVYAILTGYAEPPPGVELMPGLNYNKWFPGHQIAMPPPLSDGQVTYADGTTATVAQMAHDVTTFLAWAAEPELEARKRLGIQVILFLIVLAGLLYAAKRKIWRDVH